MALSLIIVSPKNQIKRIKLQADHSPPGHPGRFDYFNDDNVEILFL